MSFSLRISELRFFLLFIVGSESLKFSSSYQYKPQNFGLDFLGGISYLNENGSLNKMVEKSCSNELKILENALKRKDLGALQFPDAWAKMPDGILYGHTTEMGNFDECLSSTLQFDGSLQINGKYCLANLKVARKDYNISMMNFFKKIELNLGICIPKACNAMEIQLLLNNYLHQKWNITAYNASFLITENDCSTKNGEPYRALDWVAIGILIMLGLLLISGTSCDYFSCKKESSGNGLLNAFSLRKNISQLLHMTPIAETPNHIIPALHGIRCLSIIWIIFLHTNMMLVLLPNMNSVEINLWQQTLFHMIWKNGSYAVDSFFFLSGLLIISVTFREMEKSYGKLNVPLMYLHRFIRLSPVLYLAVLLFMTLYPLAGNGPMWNSFTGAYKQCEDTWWATLIYVQNYAATGRMCLGHSWYLAVDTQFYIISPIVIIVIWRWRKWGFAVLIFIGLLLIVYLFSIIIIYDLTVFNLDSAPGADSIEMRMTYYSTLARASPWIIGIIFGYYLHARKGRRVIVSKFCLILGWMLSLALFLVVIFLLYPKTQSGAEIITPLEGAFYLPLSRVAWPLGLCWLVFACVNGYAGPINDFLSCVIWQPISKLSYCMYIWHYLVVTVNAGQIKTNAHFSNYDAFLRFWSDFGITLIVSTIMYLAIEAPMLGIEKCLLSKKATKAREVKDAAITISQQNLCV